jgi:uronate dehydrogenase
MSELILVTGSAGRIGRAVVQQLLSLGHRVRGFDIQHSPDVSDSVVGSIADIQQVGAAMQQVTSVIHLAATPDEDDFLSRLLPNNIVGLYNVLESARLSRVRRVVLASSGQVTIGHKGPWPITTEMPCSPRNWYSSAKVFAEHAGQVYAYQHDLSVIVARLGWCPRDRQHADELAQHEYGTSAYLSPRDAGRFFACAVAAPRDLRYLLTFVTSIPVGQTRYDLTPARKILGYEPRDTWPQGLDLD